MVNDAERVFAAHLTDWSALGGGEQELLSGLVAEFVPTRRWEAARGFELTDEMCTVIAAQAALTCLGFGEGLDPLVHVRTIIVHPRTIVLEDEHHEGGGIMSTGTRRLSGEAHDNEGPLLLSWDSVRRETRYGRGRRNVVIHEVAHKIDMLDGTIDGTPPIDDVEFLARWRTTNTVAYGRVRRGGDPAIDGYGGANSPEFFAVVSELFFSGPTLLEEHHPELYDCFRTFYRQDTAARRRRLLA